MAPSSNAKSTASFPHTTRLAEALAGSDSLGSLMQRLAQSQARFAAIQPLLPEALRPHTRPGALDASAWMLLAANAAAAAKLRQLAPQLQTALAAAGFAEPAIRIKVSAPR